jgi:hypothetical protein
VKEIPELIPLGQIPMYPSSDEIRDAEPIFQVGLRRNLFHVWFPDRSHHLQKYYAQLLARSRGGFAFLKAERLPISDAARVSCRRVGG